MRWMREVARAIAPAVLMACASEGDQGTPDAVDTAVTESAAGSPLPVPTGTYRYDYPMDTPELVEDQFIVIDSAGGAPRLWYYGTSDEFDLAREGYRPAFFVAQATDLVLSADSLSFQLTVQPAEYFTDPVPRSYRSTAAVPGERADQAIFRSIPAGPRGYAGRVEGRELVLRTPGGLRRYQKID